jgi:hypothetical protein
MDGIAVLFSNNAFHLFRNFIFQYWESHIQQRINAIVCRGVNVFIVIEYNNYDFLDGWYFGEYFIICDLAVWIRINTQ